MIVAMRTQLLLLGSIPSTSQATTHCRARYPGSS